MVECFYTKALIPRDTAIPIGGVIPGITHKKTGWFMAPTAEAKALHKANRRAFDESDANCNTCKFLTRSSGDTRHGFLNGQCQRDGRVLRFHPDDPMHMLCYASRHAT